MITPFVPLLFILMFKYTFLLRMCQLDGEEEEPHQMNQSILYNHGVLEECFTILQQEIDVRLLVKTNLIKNTNCYTFCTVYMPNIQ